MSLSILLSIVLQFLAAQNLPAPEIVYVPLGEMAFADGCLMKSAPDGVLMHCQKDNMVIIMATTTADFNN